MISCFYSIHAESYSVLIGHELALWTEERTGIEDRRVVPDSVGLDEILSDIFTGDFIADAVYVADDSYVASRAKEIADTIGAKTLLFAGSEEFIQAGWLAGWISASEDVGSVAAEMTLEVLRDGLDPGIIPVRTPKAALFINKDAPSRQYISVPESSTPLSLHQVHYAKIASRKQARDVLTFRVRVYQS